MTKGGENLGGESHVSDCGTTTWRRGSESNRRIRLLQSPALPLGYPAVCRGEGKHEGEIRKVESGKGKRVRRDAPREGVERWHSSLLDVAKRKWNAVGTEIQ